MSADLDRLLGDTTQPTTLADTETLWARGRRRRRARHAMTAGATALVLVVGGFGVTNLIDGFGPSGMTPAGPPAAPDAAPAPEPAASDADASERPESEASPSAEDVTTPADEDSAVADESPLPDPARVADPCFGHEDRTDEAFIAVVSPVPGMEAGPQTKFIGCANVYEATVGWRVVDGTGTPLRDGFVTATCGTGCVGEFSDLIDLDGLPEDATLQVFWTDAADGSDRDLVEIPVVSE